MAGQNMMISSTREEVGRIGNDGGLFWTTAASTTFRYSAPCFFKSLCLFCFQYVQTYFNWSCCSTPLKMCQKASYLWKMCASVPWMRGTVRIRNFFFYRICIIVGMNICIKCIEILNRNMNYFRPDFTKFKGSKGQFCFRQAVCVFKTVSINCIGCI